MNVRTQGLCINLNLIKRHIDLNRYCDSDGIVNDVMMDDAMMDDATCKDDH